jgi:hypothetical protein
MIKFLIILFFIISPVAEAGEFRHFSDWSQAEKIEFFSYTGLTAIDYHQTKWAMRQYDDQGDRIYYEANPLFGKTPDNTTFLAVQLLGIGLYYYMIGKDYSKVQRGLALGFRLGVVIHNDNVGAKITKVF